MRGRDSTFFNQWPAVIPLCFCLLVNTFCLILIWKSNPDYLVDYRTNPNPDASDYVILGRNIFLHGVYSRNPAPPFVDDVFRTPIYPLLAGGCDLLGGPLALYVIQVALHCCISLITGALTASLFGNRSGMVAAIFVAVHPTIVALNFQAMAEVLCLFLMLSFLLLLERVLSDRRRTRPVSCWLAGLILGLAILTRPAGLYLPLMFAVYLVVVGIHSMGWKHSVSRALSFMLGVVLLLAPWIIRNQVTFNIPHLTTNDSIVLVYFSGAGAYQARHGVERKQAQEMIAREFHLHLPEEMWNYHHIGLSPADMDREARGAVSRVLLRYPSHLVYSCILGLGKSFLTHDAHLWGTILRKQWANPGAGNMLRLDGVSYAKLLSNPPFLQAVFFSQILINLIIIIVSLYSIITIRTDAINQPQIRLVLLLLTYLLLVCAATGPDTFTRFTAPSLPLLCLFVARLVSNRSAIAHDRPGV